MQTFERNTSHSRTLRQELDQVTRGTTDVLHNFEGRNLSNYQPLMNQEAVEGLFGIKGASLVAVIDLPVKGILTFNDDATMDSYIDRRDRASAYCFLGSASGEPPRYYLLDRAAARANLGQPIDELGISPLEKGDNLIIGRSPHNWMPSREYDQYGNEAHPDYEDLESTTARYQAMLTVTDEGRLEIWDLESKNGTAVTHSDVEVQRLDADYELGVASLGGAGVSYVGSEVRV